MTAESLTLSLKSQKILQNPQTLGEWDFVELSERRKTEIPANSCVSSESLTPYLTLALS